MSRRSGRALATLLGVAILAATLSSCAGTSPEATASAAGIRIVRFQLHRRLLRRDLSEIGVVPPGAPSGAKRPLLVFLFGRNGTPESGVNAAITMEADDGAAAPAIVLADGDPDTYWHDRASGPWGTSIVEELIPEAGRRLDVDTGRVSIAGISMGGFGALDIARLWPGRFCSVGAHSAAVWPTGGQTAAGAFDDAQDFARHDLFGYARTAAHPFGATPVWMDVGASDPFRPNDAALAASLSKAGARVSFHSWPGGHNSDYWKRHLARYAAFDAHALATCA